MVAGQESEYPWLKVMCLDGSKKNMEKFSFGVARVSVDVDSGNEIVSAQDNPMLSFFGFLVFTLHLKNRKVSCRYFQYQSSSSCFALRMDALIAAGRL